MMKSLILLLALEFGISYISLTCATPVGINGISYHIMMKGNSGTEVTALFLHRSSITRATMMKMARTVLVSTYSFFKAFYLNGFKRMTPLELETLKNLECSTMLLPKNRQPSCIDLWHTRNPSGESSDSDSSDAR
ncbi:hypothetical protein C8J57DRAFT_1519411 [Mycena rebaudengoi]|nr:hypothetical protein C8J57DRAFT_1519411 [Mycena rebaudengoi]